MKMSLAKAVALAATMGAAASAQAAISLNSNGQGQVLLYPIYTVENGNDTAISVTNTTNEYKVVKVRFREALNSQDVLDFHLFLSPQDVWNGVVVPTADGAKLFTRDTSCTVPAIPADGQAFTNLAYAGGAVETALRGQDGGPQDLKRTRVGYAEIIELGVLDANLTMSTPKPGTAPARGYTFAEAIKHVNGVPGNCAALSNEYLSGRWKDGTLTASAVVAVGPPAAITTEATGFYYGFKSPGRPNVAAPADASVAGPTTAAVYGGLYGVGTVTNVFAGQQTGYDATAIGGFIDEAGVGNLHNATGYSFPDLNGNRTPGAAITLPAAGISASNQATIGGLTYTFAKTIDAVSAVLQRTQLNNEFSVDAAVGAGTDWVVTFPTKHHYVWDSQIATDGKRATFAPNGSIGATGVFGATTVEAVPANGTVVADFTNGAVSPAFSGAVNGQLNVRPFQLASLWKGAAGAAKSQVPVTLGYLDREEKKEGPTASISFSPRPINAIAPNVLSYEANVITFNNSNLLVTNDSYVRNNLNFAAGYKSGWATVGLSTDVANNIVTPTVVPAGGVTNFAGLPALGFATIKVTNGDLDGLLSNYSSSWSHKSN